MNIIKISRNIGKWIAGLPKDVGWRVAWSMQVLKFGEIPADRSEKLGIFSAKIAHNGPLLYKVLINGDNPVAFGFLEDDGVIVILVVGTDSEVTISAIRDAGNRVYSERIKYANR